MMATRTLNLLNNIKNMNHNKHNHDLHFKYVEFQKKRKAHVTFHTKLEITISDII